MSNVDKSLPPDVVLADIERMIARLVGRETVTADESFFRLGGDSMAMMALLGQLRSRYGRAVMPRDFMVQPSAAGLTRLVLAAPRDRDARSSG